MVKLWFASDWHLGHEKIIGYTGRPFKDAAEMDDELVRRHNAVVGPSDHFYLLGDVAMKKAALGTVKRFNGRKRLILGNHDIFAVEDYLAAGFEKVMAYRVFEKTNILFSHIPVHPASMERFKANVHGHTHERNYPFPYINLSVEQIAYTPVSWEWIQARITKEQHDNKE